MADNDIGACAVGGYYRLYASEKGKRRRNPLPPDSFFPVQFDKESVGDNQHRRPAVKNQRPYSQGDKDYCRNSQQFFVFLYESPCANQRELYRHPFAGRRELWYWFP
jgi:hypothetical protein